MKAKLPTIDTQNGYNYSGDKEQVDRLILQTVTKDGIQEIVDARFWMARSSRASVVYCSIWVHGAGRYISGKGIAGGWGYHRMSAALESALGSAEIELYGSPYVGPGEKGYWNGGARQKEDLKQRAHIGGCGDKAMKDALLAIGVALGFKLKKLHIVG